MGGDHAPCEIIKGALLAIKEWDIHVTLVGKETLIQDELTRLDVSFPNSQLDIQHASEEVSMSESPSLAFKRKKDSSIAVGIKMVKEGHAQGFVSAGNTGAVMASSTLTLGRIPGIERPVLSAVLPSHNHRVLLLDIGSNVDSKPEHLCQFGIMGNCYANLVMGVDNPRVGLLNIGEEEEKGNQLTQASSELLKNTNLNFIGNVESREIWFV